MAGTYHVDLTLTAPDGTRTLIDGDLDVAQIGGATGTPPVITTPPQSASVHPGQGVTLTVVATGTPPLHYQWKTAGVDIPGATTSSYATGPLTVTTSYTVSVSNSLDLVTSAPVTITVIPVTPTVGLGLTFLGTITLPTNLDMAYAYGGLGGRIAPNGKTRLYLTGSEPNIRSPIYEIELPETVGQDSATAPRATFITDWPEPYHGKRGTWSNATQLRAYRHGVLRLIAENRGSPVVLAFIEALIAQRAKDGTPDTQSSWYEFPAMVAINGGVYWHAEHELLYVTYDDTYNVTGQPNWGLIAIHLNSDGTTETYGPWRLVGTNADDVARYGPHVALFLDRHPETGLMVVGAAMGSGNVNYPWGPALYSGAPWPTAATPAGPNVPDLVLPDRHLSYYYMGGQIYNGLPTSAIRAFKRRVHPAITEYFASDMELSLDAAKNHDDLGPFATWNEVDAIGGFFVLPDRVTFVGGCAGSPIQDRTNPGAAHEWYANGSKPLCNDGFEALPLYITGPVCRAKFPFATVYPWTKLGSNRADEWRTEPDAFVDLQHTYPNLVTAPETSTGGARGINGGFFHPSKREFYTIAHRADTVSIWGYQTSLIHVFAVD